MTNALKLHVMVCSFDLNFTSNGGVAGRGSRGPDPPASFKFTFSNDPNLMIFLLGRGVGV